MEGRTGEQEKQRRNMGTRKQINVDVELGVRTPVKRNFLDLI